MQMRNAIIYNLNAESNMHKVHNKSFIDKTQLFFIDSIQMNTI